jgi:hypothetical protein
MATMRASTAITALVVAFSFGACHRANLGSVGTTTQRFATSALTSNAKKPDFATEIKPIFQSRCMPCHFQGGKVYDKLPFDKPETVTRLGTKLFTRIKDEKEQRLIREFLAQP